MKVIDTLEPPEAAPADMSSAEALGELEQLYRYFAQEFTEALHASASKGVESHRILVARYDKRLTALAIAMDVLKRT